jgi:hypothetical protein
MPSVYLTTLKFNNRVSDIDSQWLNSFEKSWNKIKSDLEFIDKRKFFGCCNVIMFHESWEECASPGNKMFSGPFCVYRVGTWKDKDNEHVACILVLSLTLSIGN